MDPIVLANGNILVPFYVFDGDVLGDGMREVTPGDQDYEEWKGRVPKKDDAPNVPIGAVCHQCSRLHRNSDAVPPTCEAFPEGIPDAILFGANNHHLPVRGDNGLRYHPLDPAEEYALERAASGYDFREEVIDALFPPALGGVEFGEETSPGVWKTENADTGATYIAYEADADTANRVLLALNLYRVLGSVTPYARAYPREERMVVLTDFPPTWTLMGEWMATADASNVEAALTGLRSGFVADVLLGNTDLFGDGAAVAIDAENVPWRLHPKRCFADKWTEYPIEFWSLLDPMKNPGSAPLLSGLTDDQKREQIRKAERRRDLILAEIPDEAMRETFSMRLAALVQWANEETADE